MHAWTLAVHGGAGNFTSEHITKAEEREIRDAMQRALGAGGALLQAGDSALAAVEAAVEVLEDAPRFNAGRGSCYAANGKHEMEAAIMDGVTRRAGAATGLETVRHPVSLARAVMEDGRHVFLAGSGATAFAEAQGLQLEDPSFFRTDRMAQNLAAWKAYEAKQAVEAVGDGFHWTSQKFGTVGAVARDTQQRLAAATSTGGRTNKYPGRVGDTPTIGAGTYADEACAVSCTGNGEEFMRRVAAYDVSARMRYGDATLRESADSVVFDVLPEGSGGLIAVDREGTVVMPFNCSGMIRGYCRADGSFAVGLYGSEI